MSKEDRADARIQHKAVEASLFRVTAAVLENKLNALSARALVQENASLIVKNYNSAVSGNRQLLIQNTDDSFLTRFEIIAGWAERATSPTAKALAQALTHREKIVYLEHRAKLTHTGLEITLSLSNANAMALELNRRVVTAARALESRSSLGRLAPASVDLLIRRTCGMCADEDQRRHC